MPRYKLTIEYDGTGLVGWQRQENGLSVQQCLEEAFEKFLQEKVVTTAAGRTDAGVHALGQVVHVDIKKQYDLKKISGALNFHLKGKNITVVEVKKVSGKFNARHSAKKRTYLYRILNRRSPPALRKDNVWHVPVKLDVAKMKKAAKYLEGKHDFTSFRASVCQAKSPVKTIDKITVQKKGDEIHITVIAKSFLHHMVRNIVGTLQMVGNGKWQPHDVKKALEARDRNAAGPTAPAHGLYFVSVKY